MSAGITQSERFVAWLCERAFLRLWTHPNPFGKKGKELCDCLIVCGDHVIIISVKEIDYKGTGDASGWKRWTSSAVEKSVQQIWGAERWIRSTESVFRHDGREIVLPPKDRRKYHRISVSLGSSGQVPLQWGDFGNGFVHLLDEPSLAVTFGELDTITDFVMYLSAVEAILGRGVKPVFDGGGPEDFLGLYVQHGPSFGMIGTDGTTPDLAVVTGDIWKGVIESPAYIARNEDLRSSYAWDNLIEHFADDLLTDGMFDMHSKQVTKNELALVAMAMQPRGHRANLADSLIAYLGPGGEKIAARAIVAGSGTAFVFVGGDSKDRQRRAQELALRCLVVRGRCPGISTVVGLATDRPTAGRRGYSTDIAYIHMSDWSELDNTYVVEIQKNLGYFRTTKWPQ